MVIQDTELGVNIFLPITSGKATGRHGDIDFSDRSLEP